MNEEVNKQRQNSNPLGWIAWWFLWWRLDSNETEKQINQYDDLGIIRSFRGIAALLTASWVLLTELFSITNWIPNNKFVVSLFMYQEIGLFSLFLYLLLAFLIFKGKKWAILIAMILQTVNSGYALFHSVFLVEPDILFWFMIIFWWSLFMRFFYGALRVEQLKDKSRNNEK